MQNTLFNHLQTDILCPCGSGQTYADCCRICHLDHVSVSTAQQLMRSRYSAFVFKLTDYLLQTWHVSKRPRQLNLDDDATQWIGLEILACSDGAGADRIGTVEFKAHYQLHHSVGCLHEVSRFRRESGYWFYLDGKIKPDKALLLKP
jgi:SEC-C motif domain protein